MKKVHDGLDGKGKSPSFPMYPMDFLRDMEPCTNFEVGVWTKILFRLHFSPHRGYLEHDNEKPFTEADIAALIKESVTKTRGVLAELKRKGIYSVDERGCIFNRRMARESDISQKRRDASAKRWGEQKVCTDFAYPKGDAYSMHKPLPSSSSSSSSLKEKAKRETDANSEPDADAFFSVENGPNRTNPNGAEQFVETALPAPINSNPYSHLNTVKATGVIEIPQPLPINTDAYEDFLKIFKGRPDECRKEFVRYVYSAERIQLLMKNTPLWMTTAAYKSGFHSASSYLRSLVWERTPQPELLNGGMREVEYER
jgi:hypothetical protein